MPIKHSSLLGEKISPCLFNVYVAWREALRASALTVCRGVPSKAQSCYRTITLQYQKPSPAPSCREQVRQLAMSNFISLLLSEMSSQTRSKLKGCHISLCFLAAFCYRATSQGYMNKITHQARLDWPFMNYSYSRITVPLLIRIPSSLFSTD